MAWYRAPHVADGSWQGHLVDQNVESVVHFVGVADFNGDSRPDIAIAEMNQSEDPDVVAIYVNGDDGAAWNKTVLSHEGSHSMRIIDANADFKPDLFGANFSLTGVNVRI